MKITVITTCFNRVHSIGAAMESVLGQDYDDVEYIIVDGASSDGSVEEIRRMEALTQGEAFRRAHPRFVLRVVSEPDHGMYEAINKGIRMATGEVIGLLHSDDVLYTPRTLSCVMAAVEASGCDFLYADGIYVSDQNPRRVRRVWKGGRYTKWKVRHGWLPLHTTCYIKRATMERLGLYDETFRIAADSDLLVRYLLESDLRVHYLPQCVVRMNMGGLSTNRRKQIEMFAEDRRVYSSHHFRHARITKIEKMAWKVPQFLLAVLVNLRGAVGGRP